LFQSSFTERQQENDSMMHTEAVTSWAFLIIRSKQRLTHTLTSCVWVWRVRDPQIGPVLQVFRLASSLALLSSPEAGGDQLQRRP